MSIEAKNNYEEDFKYEYNKIQNDVLKPGTVKYLRESNDKKYKIYAYKLSLWGNKWGIKNKFEQQIWKWKEWTQFADADWNIIEKSSFKAWEIVYLRVPNKKEATNDKAKEFNEEEIMKFTRKDISSFNLIDWNYQKDNKWEYILFKGKKLYTPNYNDPSKDKDWAYVMSFCSSEHMWYSFYVKKWNEYRWVYVSWTDNYFYKWTLELRQQRSNKHKRIWPSDEIMKMLDKNNDPKYKFNVNR